MEFLSLIFPCQCNGSFYKHSPKGIKVQKAENNPYHKMLMDTLEKGVFICIGLVTQLNGSSSICHRNNKAKMRLILDFTFA